MRATIATAVACVIGVASFAQDARAALRKRTEIPSEPLELALQTFASERAIQVIYRSELVWKLTSGETRGDFTAGEALSRLLENTGLTFHYLDDHTVTIVRATPSPIGSVTREGAAPLEMASVEPSDPSAARDARDRTADRARGRIRLAQADQATQGELPEVTVTATRQEEALSKVPISVAAFSQEQMDVQGVKQLDDLVRLTPGLNLTRSSFTGANQIAIRGISSSAGAGTTGVYIDDTPMQVRNLGFGAASAFPGFFDLQRVEVLRGPQGTLFGAGSEGGTVRFIQTEPSLTHYSGYARAEIATTEQGAPSAEAGVAFGGPIITDQLGFRGSVFFRRDGGYIDQVSGNFTTIDPEGALYGKSSQFARTSIDHKDVNWKNTSAVRLALEWAPSDSFRVTPSFFYQNLHNNEGLGSTYWLSTSSGRNFSRPDYTAGDPSKDPVLTPMVAPTNQKGDDQFTLSAIGLDWQLSDSLELISNTSYFNRHNDQWADFTNGYVQFYLAFVYPYPPAGYKSMTDYINGQKNFVQEFRLQSRNPESRLNWVAGVFYAHNKQVASQPIYVNFTQNQPVIGFAADFAGFADGPPYGPGSSALANFLGINNGPNSLDYQANWQTIEEQVAGFAQLDFKITEQLKLTVGARYSHNKLSYDAAFGGPETNGAAPFGYPCIPGTFCDGPGDPNYIVPGTYAVGTGPFTPVFPNSSTSGSENATTPKVGAEFQINDANMLYATAAKGFRPAGASLRVPTVCQGDLETFGYVDANGQSTQPITYKSDSVWSYELGSKNRLFGGRVAVDGSAYYIKWKSIQTDVFLPNCAYDFVDNLADATSKGFDIAVQAKPIRSLTLGLAIGYNKATFDDNALSPSGRIVYGKGSAIPDGGAPWTGSAMGEYEFHAFGEHNFYLHADYTHTSVLPRTGNTNTDPTAPRYDPLRFPTPAYSMVNTRLGFRTETMDISVFINNLTDAEPEIFTHSTFYNPWDWNGEATRPRTYGLTVTYRN